MKKVTRLLSSLLLGVCSMSFAAENLSHMFTPRVTIFGASSSAIMITADKYNYTTLYKPDQQTFNDLLVPFVVTSIGSEPVNYRLTLPVTDAYCEQNEEVTLITDLSFKLDDSALTEAGKEFTGLKAAEEKAHNLLVQFPQIPQTNSLKQCYGTLGVQVEVIL